MERELQFQRIVCRYSRSLFAGTPDSTFSTSLFNVAGELHSLKGMVANCHNPDPVLKLPYFNIFNDIQELHWCIFVKVTSQKIWRYSCDRHCPWTARRNVQKWPHWTESDTSPTPIKKKKLILQSQFVSLKLRLTPRSILKKKCAVNN